jgi:hypothetical protein
MAKLTISDAARGAGVARSTLHRAIHAGRLSVDADGRVDTAELLRAGYTLQRSTQQHRGGALQDATPRASDAQPSRSPVEIQGILTVQQERDMLRRELEAAQAREQAARAREQEARAERQTARGREALLLRMVEQMQQRYDRLLEAPRSAPPPGAARAQAPPRPRPPGATTAADTAPVPAPRLGRGRQKSRIRQEIEALLRAHPEGLTTELLRGSLNPGRPIGDILSGMRRTQAVRTQRGDRAVRYFLAEAEP